MNRVEISLFLLLSIISSYASDRELLGYSGLYGNSNGGVINDMHSSDSSAYITKICARSGAWVDYIELYWNNGDMASCGGGGGVYSCFDIPSDECILSTEVYSGSWIDGFKFITDKGTHSQHMGSFGGIQHTVSGTGCLKAINARCGTRVDSLQFKWQNINDRFTEMECKEDANYRNDFDGNHDNIQSNNFISGQASWHHNHYEDRVFRWKYCKPKSFTSFSDETILPATGYDEEWTRSCDDLNGGHAAIKGIQSYHDDHTDDRAFTIHCGGLDVQQYRLTDCFWTSQLNNFDENVYYMCPGSGVVRSIWSRHDNSPEDRIFKFECCNVVDVYVTDFSNKMGKWELRQSCSGCPSHTYRTEEGVTSTTGQSITLSYTNELSKSISFGVAYEIGGHEGGPKIRASGSVGLTTTVSNTISRTMQSSMSKTTKEIEIITCDKTYLYQWITSGTEIRSDGSTGTFHVDSNNYLCTGHEYPQCPLGYCKDPPDCQICDAAVCFINSMCHAVLNLGYRTSEEIQSKTQDDCRNIMIHELSLISNEDIPTIQSYNNHQIMGKLFSAEILVSMGVSENELKTLSTDTQRNKLIVEINQCTQNYYISSLQGMSDKELSCLADANAC